MSTNLVIVAIPEEQDRVWKISSEKVPHLTLLFLGEEQTADTQQVMQFVEHAVQMSEHGPFYLDVERRGELGPDQADVIFFNKRSWNLKWVKQFRSQLLQNNAVRTAYDSAEQFEEWTPHLTLGYPETPAKEPENNGFDHPLYSVCFDRIAIWTGDFAGPDFRLEWPDRELEGDLAIAYSDAQKAALLHDGDLEHFGAKGMRWGQSRNRIDRKNGRDPKRLAILAGRGKKKTEKVLVGGKEKQVTPKKAAKLDKNWEKNIYSLPGAIAVHNSMATHFNERIGTVNDKYKKDNFAKTNWDKPESLSPREKQYDGEIKSLVTAGNRKAVEEVHGKSPTGKRRAELNGDRIIVREEKVQHAADDTEAVAVLKITRNSEGLITKAEPLVQSEDVATHGEIFVEGLVHGVPELGEAFLLEHFGIKGMRWGQRGAPTAVATTSTSKVPHGNRRKTKIKAKGGQNHPAHEDAIKVAESRAKLKKSGVAALSNHELRTVANRLQLENQVAVLNSSKGKRFVTQQFKSEGQNLAREGIREGVKRGSQKVAKTGAKAGAAALI